MTAEVDTIASNVSRLAIRRENASEWLTLKPVSYADFGAETEKEENQVIEPGRNREKEVSVGINAPAGFKANFTPESLGHFADGVFLVTEKATPSSGGRFGSGSPTVVATGYDIGTDAAAAGFVAGQLVYAEFWGEGSNNGLHVVTGTLANVVQVTGLTVEGSPPSDAYVKVVGHEFAAADVDVVVTGGSYPTLVSTANAFNTADLIPGMWIYSGGGSAGSNQFNTDGNSSVMRLRAVEAGTLTLDRSAGGADLDTAMASEVGTGISLRIFYGDFFRNVSAIGSNYVEQRWDLERTLGVPNPQASPGVTQAEYVLEALLNTVTVVAPAKKKLEFDLEFIGKTGDTRTGQGGSLLRTNGATLNDLLDADAFSTATDKLINRVYVLPDESAGNAIPDRLFKHLTEQTLTLSNNAVIEDAHGEFGALEIVPGDFSFAAEMTAHFADVAAQAAVQGNLDIGYQLGYANTMRDRRAGVIFDCPRGSLGNGRNNVERNSSIKTPLTFSGARSETFGYTASLSELPYLP